MQVFPRYQEVTAENELKLNSKKWVKFKPINFKFSEFLLFHSNGMRLWCLDEDRNMLFSQEYFSVGGGFIVNGATHTAPDFQYLALDKLYPVIRGGSGAPPPDSVT